MTTKQKQKLCPLCGAKGKIVELVEYLNSHKETFEKDNPMLWGMIRGSYLYTINETYELLSKHNQKTT